MHFPDPTQKPTAADYVWARDIAADDFSLRLDWLLRQVALRGLGRAEFCRLASVNVAFLQLLTCGHREKARPTTWEKVIDCLERTENDVPEALWRRQHLFPYHEKNLEAFYLDMSVAGFSTLSLQSELGRDPGKRIGKVKTPNPDHWADSVTTVYTVLDGFPELPEEVIRKFFPYDPYHHPETAQEKIQKFWQLQEMSGASEKELSHRIGRNLNGTSTDVYLRRIKLNRGELSVRDYAILVRELQKKKYTQEAAKVKDSYKEFFPFSETSYELLRTRADRLGFSFTAMHKNATRIFGGDAVCYTYITQALQQRFSLPSQNSWRQLVLAVQATEEDMYQKFNSVWYQLYQNPGHYSRLVTHPSAVESFKSILAESKQGQPIPVNVLVPALFADLTFGGCFGRPHKPRHNNLVRNAYVVNVLKPITILLENEESVPLDKGMRLLIHQTPGFLLPVAILAAEDLASIEFAPGRANGANRVWSNGFSLRP